MLFIQKPFLLPEHFLRNQIDRTLFCFELEYENIERAAGETKWSFWKLLLYAVDGIIAFSTAPLVLSSVLGFLFCIIAVVMTIVIIIRTCVFGDPTPGWPSLWIKWLPQPCGS